MPIKGIKGGVGTKALGYGLGAAEEASEPHFNQTTLLLHADGSEGEGNTSALGDPNYKAFRDNSTSAHALTVVGGAYGNDFSPYYYADGYWSIATNTAGNISLGTRVLSNLAGDKSWTIEGWVYFPDIGNAYTNLISAYTSGQVNSVAIFLRGSGQSYEPSSISLATYGGSNITFLNPGSNSIPHNEWFHFAFVRDSSNGNGYCFINGVLEQTVSFSATSFYDADNKMNDVSPQNYYFSNFRIVDGTAVYTSAFTPSTAPLTAITNTTFLMGQSNRFIDNSSSPVTITPNSNGAEISTNTPFTQSKTANVGSGFFDQTDDHVEIATASSDFNLGTGQFTFEAWIYTQSTDQQTVMIAYVGSTDFNIYIHDDAVHLYTSSVIIDGNSGSIESFIQRNAWSHIVMQRDSSNYLTVYVNGVRKYYTVNTTDFGATSKIRIGEHENGSNEFKGYIADVRFVKGSAVYSGSTITVPTSSLTAVTNTKLLTCQYSGAVRNEGFVDASKYNHRITRIGDASLGTFSPFSLEDTYWSNYLNGNHPIEIADSGNGLDLSGDFTVEFWAYEPKIATTNATVNMYFTIDTLDRFQFSNNGSNAILYINGGSVFSSTTPPLNQWNHIALVREGSGSNNLSYYLNGTRQTQATNTYSIAAASMMLGGQDRGGTTGYHGSFMYISNLRILKGTALYSGASITVPTEPLTAITNTSLLTCQSNRFIDNSTNSMALTTDNSSPAEVLPFSPFAPTRSYSKDAVGGSAYFGGSGNKLKILGDATSFQLDDAKEWCVEFWVYMINPTDNYARVMQINNGNGWTIRFDGTSGKIGIGRSDAGSTDSIEDPTALPANQWTHFAFTNKNQSGTYHLRLFRNGAQVATTSGWTQGWTNADNSTDAGSLMIAAYYTGAGSPNNFAGEMYLATTRLIQGDYVYDSAFTPTTAPLTANDKTKLLLNFNNAGIIDHTMKNVLRTVDNTRVITTDKKFGTGSLVFDGDDYLEAVNTEDRKLFTPETGDMTWEMFVKFDILDGDHCLFSKYGSGSEYQFYYSNGSSEWRLSYHATTNAWSDSSISTGTWYHIALVKDGTTVYLFKDGTSLGTNTMTYNTSQTGRPFILGTSFNGSNSALYQLKGKLDEVRVTKLARYTSNFTAPTKSFANR